MDSYLKIDFYMPTSVESFLVYLLYLYSQRHQLETLFYFLIVVIIVVIMLIIVSST